MTSKNSSKSMNVNILHLYRNILRHAQVFPSKNRLGIIREIKATFRENKKMKNTKEVERAVKLGIEGLEQLSMYSSLKSKAGDWSVTLSQDPMPRPSGKDMNK